MLTFFVALAIGWGAGWLIKAGFTGPAGLSMALRIMLSVATGVVGLGIGISFDSVSSELGGLIGAGMAFGAFGGLSAGQAKDAED